MELSKNYDPAGVEARWYKHWLDKGYFRSIPDNRKAFTVVIPPPNVTGVLHMGHTLNETVQDILVRKARMSGYNACWVPGSDHASIATEARVVQMLKDRGIDKNELTREAFLNYAFEWKDKYGGIIYDQIARLGCSVDWDRVSFTMDDDYYRAVIAVFIDLYRKGLIYRGARMINWDPSAKTALSDEEVEYKDITGTLYYIRYRVVDGLENEHPAKAEYITIATQRPETIMGDTAVCVNPGDERYAHLRGKFVLVPLVKRKVPVIFDEYVDASFGTGALKITPAHDINDYNIGLKHHLTVIDTLNEDGTLSEAAEVFVGLDRFEARRRAIAQLKAEGLLVKEEEYQTRLGYSQRTHAVVEPRISTQWFVKMKELAGPALDAVLKGEIKIHPGDKFLATYKYWLENVKDWCISRQLWWGQQIPAWYGSYQFTYVGTDQQEAEILYRAHVKRHIETMGGREDAAVLPLARDPDVLDTWFSSWLWPIEVFKGITRPANAEISYYYPTAVLVTGQDIIFFWVARMIMAGFAFKEEKPFSDVYFTGMVRDKQGRKMSKSLGNSPDLLKLIDKYGADAVRFGIMISSPAGNDLLFDEASLEQGRNFNNKLWNALKLVKLWEDRVDASVPPDNGFALAWFDNRLRAVRMETDLLLNQFKLSEALKIIYSLIWDDFCSWYLEWIKPGFEKPVAKNVYEQTIYFFEQLMQLLHPFMPFVTEELYHLLAERSDDLCVKQFNAVGLPDNALTAQGELLQEVITALREFRTKSGLKAKDRISVYVDSTEEHYFGIFKDILQKQLGIEDLHNIQTLAGDHSTIIIRKDTFHIKSAAIIVDNDSRRQELIKEMEYLQGFLIPVNKKLQNEKFVQNAKPEVLALERKKKEDAEAKIKVLGENLAGFS